MRNDRVWWKLQARPMTIEIQPYFEGGDEHAVNMILILQKATMTGHTNTKSAEEMLLNLH